MTFEQGGLAYQEAVRIEDGKFLFNQRTQKQITTFCNKWMQNIADQQNL